MAEIKRRIKALIDGKRSQVIDLETGLSIPFVSIQAGYDFSDLGGPEKLVIEVYLRHCEVDVEGEATIKVLCPGCRKAFEDDVKMIEGSKTLVFGVEDQAKEEKVEFREFL